MEHPRASPQTAGSRARVAVICRRGAAAAWATARGVVLGLLLARAGPAGTPHSAPTRSPAAGEAERERSSPAELRSLILGFSGLAGRLTARELRYRSLPPFTDLTCGLVIKSKSDSGPGATKPTWCFENARADFCGGRFACQAQLSFQPEGRTLSLKARLAGVKLDEFTRKVGRVVTPGILGGEIELTLGSKGREELHGTASAHIRGGNLGRFPVVLSIVSFLTLGFPRLEQEVIEEADFRVTIAPRAIIFQRAELRSRGGGFVLRAERGGTAGYDGTLNFYFRPVIAPSVIAGVPVVGAVAEEIVKKVRERGMRLKVTGTISKPEFQWAAFN